MLNVHFSSVVLSMTNLLVAFQNSSGMGTYLFKLIEIFEKELFILNFLNLFQRLKIFKISAFGNYLKLIIQIDKFLRISNSCACMSSI